MKRRDLLRFAGTSLLTAGLGITYTQNKPVFAQKPTSGGVTIQWLGHSCFLFTGSGVRILVNPFLPIGCTAKYKPPQVEADVVMISSRLLDEGFASELPGKPQLIVESGVYDVKGIEIQGINTFHDREKGRRFGLNVAWKWTQGGVKIIHLGGAASPIEIEQKILMGTPDVALIPVGNSPKAYNPEEAFAAMKALNPRVVIPTQYLTQAADKANCDLVGVDQFLELAKTNKMNTSIIKNDKITFKAENFPKEGTLVRVFDTNNVFQTAMFN
jgi:L-ascorbate metabolism protein UlaG (beta-lactamase superfamily)